MLKPIGTAECDWICHISNGNARNVKTKVLHQVRGQETLEARRLNWEMLTESDMAKMFGNVPDMVGKGAKLMTQ